MNRMLGLAAWASASRKEPVADASAVPDSKPIAARRVGRAISESPGHRNLTPVSPEGVGGREVARPFEDQGKATAELFGHPQQRRPEPGGLRHERPEHSARSAVSLDLLVPVALHADGEVLGNEL